MGILQCDHRLLGSVSLDVSTFPYCCYFLFSEVLCKSSSSSILMALFLFFFFFLNSCCVYPSFIGPLCHMLTLSNQSWLLKKHGLSHLTILSHSRMQFLLLNFLYLSALFLKQMLSRLANFECYNCHKKGHEKWNCPICPQNQCSTQNRPPLNAASPDVAVFDQCSC